MIRRVVLTGGVGSGKTSLLHELRLEASNTVFEEVAFDFVKSELKKIDGLLPWTDPLKFCERIVQIRVDQFQSVTKGLSFYDRGIPDPYAFLMLDGIDPPDLLIEAARTYIYDYVFLCPPWKNIYINRPERPQTWEYAEKLGLSLREVYESLGYFVIEVPRLSIKARTNFITEIVAGRNAP